MRLVSTALSWLNDHKVWLPPAAVTWLFGFGVSPADPAWLRVLLAGFFAVVVYAGAAMAYIVCHVAATHLGCDAPEPGPGLFCMVYWLAGALLLADWTLERKAFRSTISCMETDRVVGVERWPFPERAVASYRACARSTWPLPEAR